MNAHHLFPNVTLAQIGAEIRRELDHRRRLYPRLVAKGDMHPDEEAHLLAVCGAWAQDVERIAACWGKGTAPAPATHAISWADRTAACRRELDLRERHYPGWIRKGDLTQGDAQRQIDRLHCLLAIYEDGWDWTAEDGSVPHACSATAEALAQAGREEYETRKGDGNAAEWLGIAALARAELPELYEIIVPTFTNDPTISAGEPQRRRIFARDISTAPAMHQALLDAMSQNWKERRLWCDSWRPMILYGQLGWRLRWQAARADLRDQQKELAL